MCSSHQILAFIRLLWYTVLNISKNVTRWYPGKYLIAFTREVLQGGKKKKTWLKASANFYGVNIPMMANFKLPHDVSTRGSGERWAYCMWASSSISLIFYHALGPLVTWFFKIEITQKFNSILYMGETQENWVTHQNGWSPPLSYHLLLKTIILWERFFIGLIWITCHSHVQ